MNWCDEAPLDRALVVVGGQRARILRNIIDPDYPILDWAVFHARHQAGFYGHGGPSRLWALDDYDRAPPFKGGIDLRIVGAWSMESSVYQNVPIPTSEAAVVRGLHSMIEELNAA
jgi:hypothetical protein